jgi:hypothetical protein
MYFKRVKFFSFFIFLLIADLEIQAQSLKKEINTYRVEKANMPQILSQSPNSKNTESISVMNQTTNNNNPNHTQSFHFENDRLSKEIVAQINFNKLHGKSLSEGIYKSYKVSIELCRNLEDVKNKLSFLNNVSGFIKYEFISDGLVRLNVAPEFISTDLKERLLLQKIEFNFLEEVYFLK